MECNEQEGVSLRVLLPPLSFLPDGAKLDDGSVFSLAQQWGKGWSHVVRRQQDVDTLYICLSVHRLVIIWSMTG